MSNRDEAEFNKRAELIAAMCAAFKINKASGPDIVECSMGLIMAYTELSEDPGDQLAQLDEHIKVFLKQRNRIAIHLGKKKLTTTRSRSSVASERPKSACDIPISKEENDAMEAFEKLLSEGDRVPKRSELH